MDKKLSKKTISDLVKKFTDKKENYFRDNYNETMQEMIF